MTGTCACHITLTVVRKLNEIRAPLFAILNNQICENYAEGIQLLGSGYKLLRRENLNIQQINN